MVHICGTVHESKFLRPWKVALDHSALDTGSLSGGYSRFLHDLGVTDAGL